MYHKNHRVILKKHLVIQKKYRVILKKYRVILKKHQVILKMTKRLVVSRPTHPNRKNLRSRRAQKKSKNVRKNIKKRWLSSKRKRSWNKWRTKNVAPWTLPSRRHRSASSMSPKTLSAALRSKIQPQNRNVPMLVIFSTTQSRKWAKTRIIWVGALQASSTAQVNCKVKCFGVSKRKNNWSRRREDETWASRWIHTSAHPHLFPLWWAWPFYYSLPSFTASTIILFSKRSSELSDTQIDLENPIEAKENTRS